MKIAFTAACSLGQRFLAVSMIAILLLALSACSEGTSGEQPPVIDDTVATRLDVDRGEVGVVVDAREIVKKGYAAATVAIQFADHAKFNATLGVDSVTGLAILRIRNDSLTPAEKAAFSNGVAAHFVVADAAGGQLAVHDETGLPLDDSGMPLSIETTKPFVARPLVLREGVPYLLQADNQDSVLVRRARGLGTEWESEMHGSTNLALNGPVVPARCPDGSIAIGANGLEALGLGLEHYLESIGLLCAELTSDGTLGAESFSLQLPPRIGQPGPKLRCPNALFVRDFGHTYSGIVSYGVRNATIYCRSLEEVMSGEVNTGATLSPGALGGAPVAGDTPHNLACPTGYAVTGVRGRVIGGLSAIGYICREVLVGWSGAPYVPDNPAERFYFTPVVGAQDANTYAVRQFSQYWAAAGGVLTMVPLEADAGRFVLEPQEDGWAKIRLQGTQEYLVPETDGRMALSNTAQGRFRIITDDVEWTVTDRGTVYHQPIVPPAQLDFAYAATIKNCSSAEVTETIGQTQSRTQTATISTFENLQLFAGYEWSLGAKIGVAVEAGAIVSKVSGSAEVSINHKITVSGTRTTGNTLTEESSKTSEVSRTRTIQVPAFTAIEAYDAVRTINDFRIPFTQVYRFSGTYKEDGSRLTGPEILTYMQFNFVQGVPTAVAAEHVDIGIRGMATVDQMFEAETQVKQIAGACN